MYVYVLRMINENWYASDGSEGTCEGRTEVTPKYFSSEKKGRDYIDRIVERRLNKGYSLLETEEDNTLHTYMVKISDGEEAIQEYGYETITNLLLSRHELR